jgi:hypothetical protein
VHTQLAIKPTKDDNKPGNKSSSKEMATLEAADTLLWGCETDQHIWVDALYFLRLPALDIPTRRDINADNGQGRLVQGGDHHIEWRPDGWLERKPKYGIKNNVRLSKCTFELGLVFESTNIEIVALLLESLWPGVGD